MVCGVRQFGPEFRLNQNGGLSAAYIDDKIELGAVRRDSLSPGCGQFADFLDAQLQFVVQCNSRGTGEGLCKGQRLDGGVFGPVRRIQRG